MSRASGLQEIITNEVTGILVPERDPGAIAAATERLMNDPSFSKRLGENARRYVHEAHSYVGWARELVSVYERVISKRQRRLS